MVVWFWCRKDSVVGGLDNVKVHSSRINRHRHQFLVISMIAHNLAHSVLSRPFGGTTIRDRSI
jgi:hypothetical protein